MLRLTPYMSTCSLVSPDTPLTSFGALEVGFTVAGALFIKHVTNDADSPLLWFYDLTDTPTNGLAFGLNKHGDGHWMKFTRAAGS